MTDCSLELCKPLEDNRFQSISDFKWCMKRNGEVQFRWKGIPYTIVHVHDKIVVSLGYYQKDGKYYNISTNQEHSSKDELWGDTADDILEFNVSGDRLRDAITQVTVLARTI